MCCSISNSINGSIVSGNSNTVGPLYTADHYNTKSDITWSDLGNRFVESTAGHFYVKWHEIRHWHFKCYSSCTTLLQNAKTIKEILEAITGAKHAPMNVHLLVHKFASFIWKSCTISGGWISPIQHGCYLLRNFAETFYFPRKQLGNIFV